MNAAELSRAIIAAKAECDEAIRDLERASVESAKADQAWRLARSTAILSTAGTVQEREARTDKATADERYQAKLSEDFKTAMLEKVRSTRQWMSALQSLAAANRAEAELARWEPREVSA